MSILKEKNISCLNIICEVILGLVPSEIELLDLKKTNQMKLFSYINAFITFGLQSHLLQLIEPIFDNFFFVVLQQKSILTNF